MYKMNVCIIGAGMAGLCSAKYALQNHLQPTIFEQTNKIGGTWVYTDKIGKNEFGLDIHSSMYKGLRTNLPKEIMGFPDFPIPDQDKSYIYAKDVLEFLNSYSKHFHVNEHIKFQNHVLNVRPNENGKWEVVIRNLPRNISSTQVFDFVMVCNGHYHNPFIPNIPEIENFKGKQFHSHEFRCTTSLRDETVLVIGAGSSSQDLAVEISKVAKSVTVSHHMKNKLNIPENILQKPDVIKILANSVKFSDQTENYFSVIIYCTGYKYSFSFLSEECGIKVDDNYIQPLYKHCINIKHPSMVFIGLPFRCHISHMMDLQVRFVMKIFQDEIKLPSFEEMMKITKDEMENRWTNGYKNRHAHMLGPKYRESYYTELSKLGKIDNLKPVLNNIYKDRSQRADEDFLNYRNDVYRIVDDEHFIRTSCDK